MFYALSRTFSNSAETYLTMFAFYFWPFPNSIGSLKLAEHARRRRYALLLAAMACILRVTNAVVWIPLALREGVLLWQLKEPRLQRQFLLDVLAIALVSISVLVAIDSVYYGEFTVTPLNFYHFNTTLNGSALYGTHAWYWYWLVGLPTIVGTMTPSLAYALQFITAEWGKHGSQKRRTHFALMSKLLPLLCCTWTLLVFSLNPHKEFRFLLPLLPVLLIYCGLGLCHIFVRHRSAIKYVMLVLLTTNTAAGLFLAQWHQAAPIDVMRWLNTDIESTVAAEGNGYAAYGHISVAFVLPCHSTPLYSHLHVADDHVALQFLECNPHFDAEGKLTRSNTQSWWLELNPEAYFGKLTTAYQGGRACPEYMVVSSHHLAGAATSTVEQCGYTERVRYLDNYLEDAYLVVMSTLS